MYQALAESLAAYEGLITGKPAPTFCLRHLSNVKAGLPAKTTAQALQLIDMAIIQLQPRR